MRNGERFCQKIEVLELDDELGRYKKHQSLMRLCCRNGLRQFCKNFIQEPHSRRSCLKMPLRLLIAATTTERFHPLLPTTLRTTRCPRGALSRVRRSHKLMLASSMKTNSVSACICTNHVAVFVGLIFLFVGESSTLLMTTREFVWHRATEVVDICHLKQTKAKLRIQLHQRVSGMLFHDCHQCCADFHRRRLPRRSLPSGCGALPSRSSARQKMPRAVLAECPTDVSNRRSRLFFRVRVCSSLLVSNNNTSSKRRGNFALCHIRLLFYSSLR